MISKSPFSLPLSVCIHSFDTSTHKNKHTAIKTHKKDNQVSL